MWILSFFPDFTVYLILITGLVLFLAATFLGMVPFINQYKTPGQILGVILLAFGLYLKGGLDYKVTQELEVAKLEKKLAEAEAKSAQTNTEIVEKIVKDTEVIRLKGKTIIEYVDREIIKYDDQCIIPSEVIDAHNAAATMDLSKLKGEEK